MGMPPNDLKLFTAILVAIALSLPLICKISLRVERWRAIMLEVKNIYKTFFPGTINEKKRSRV
jgi:hypothetical protein